MKGKLLVASIIGLFVGLILFSNPTGLSFMPLLILSIIGFFIFALSLGYLISYGLYRAWNTTGLVVGILLSISILSGYMLIGMKFGILIWPPHNEILETILFWIFSPTLIMSACTSTLKLIRIKVDGVTMRFFCRQHGLGPLVGIIVVAGVLLAGIVWGISSCISNFS